MRSLLRQSSTPSGLIFAAVCLILLAASVLIAGRAAADSQLPAAGKRLITIHDNGQDRAILTEAPTLREAFKDAGINLDGNDLVEPGLDDKLVAANYEVNVYRARPVTIVDGAIRKRVMSPYRTASQIIEHAGMSLHDEDRTAMGIASNIVSDGAGIELDIDRATPFTLVMYGKKTLAYTQGATVADMLREKGITLGANDTLSTAKSAPIRAGMTVELWRNGTQTFTQDEDIPFEVEQVQDMDHEVGYKKVQTPGVKGKRTVTYEIIMRNGVQVSRKEIQSVITKKPETQVEVVGVKANLPPGSHEDWMAAAGIAASDYGYVNYIVSHEGGWEPCKVQGGAIDCTYDGYMGYGVVQATPGSKMASAGADWRTNPITQLQWATGYAVGRYGSWEGAYDHWVVWHSW